MPTIHQYNNAITAWDFEKEKLADFLMLLSDRNKLIIASTPRIDFFPERDDTPINEAFILADPLIKEAAFHLGFPHQRKLCPLIDEDTGNPCNEGVFFSLKAEDVFALSEFVLKPETMVYFLDPKNVKGAMVQTQYGSDVLSRRDLEGILSLPSQIIKRKRHADLNRTWIKKNTMPFKMEKMLACRDNYPEWLIVPGPILVRY